jgi:murein DD-endopeptidase MepM/ murein hydrolase activator NlpD
MEAIMERLQKTVSLAGEYLEKYHLKNVAIISGAAAVVLIGVVLALVLSTNESMANVSFREGKISDLIKYKGWKPDELFKSTYTEVSERDKEMAYVYLLKKLNVKNVNFTLYKVKLGENLWGVARDFGTNIDTIAGANPELKDLKARLNQQIIILSKKGIIHEVRDEQKLEQIADIYKIPAARIRFYNNIEGDTLKPGDLVFVPEAKPIFLNGDMAKLFEKRRLFRSPLSGEYTSLKGMRKDPLIRGVSKYHNGVDIRAKIGTWVGAAADGVVIAACWQGGYGNCVVIKHANGYQTLYAHLSQIFVRPGQKVLAGKLIAKTGSTGRSTGPHLHFSIFKNGKVEDPLDYLW